MKRVMLFIAILSGLAFGMATYAKSESYAAKIPYFAGTIEIMYPDGGRSVLKTGDRVPEELPPGTIIRVVDGTLAVKMRGSVDQYNAGQTVRITQDE